MCLYRLPPFSLSLRMIAEVYKDGKVNRAEFETGVAKGGLRVVGETEKSGTSITFYPDPTIFKETVEFSYEWVVNYLRHQAYLTKGVLTEVVDERSGARDSFYFEGGIKSYVKKLNVGKEVLADEIFYKTDRRQRGGDCGAV